MSVFYIQMFLVVIVGIFLVFAGILYRKKILQEMLVASLFALFVTSYHTYVYDSGNLFLGNINIFPLVLWIGGLVILREVYERYTGSFRFLVISFWYVFILFIIEYIGYYVLRIQLSQGGDSLLGLGIIHGTLFLHMFYIFAGPIYLLVTDYLNVE